MRLCMQKTSRHCYICVAQCCSRRSWALPVVATRTKTTTWPQMWLEMKEAKRRKLLNMSESKHETLHAKNFTPLLCLRCTVLLQAQLGPACRSDHNEDNHLAANVPGNERSQKKKAIKHVRKQTCQNRQESHAAVRWTFCRPSCGEHANHAGRRNMNLIPKQAGDAAR